MEAEEPSGLHDYWGKPAENWYDYFMLHDKLQGALNEPITNKALLARLTIQFAEMAITADTDEKLLTARQMPSDDVLFAQRKAACLWLCAMSCFSALEWNYESLLEEHDVQSVRPVMEYVYRMFRNRELSADPFFGEWLMDKFILTIERLYRIQMPPAKQTVNNPAQTADNFLIRHETNKRMIQEVRDRTFAVVQATELLAKEGKTVYVPGYHCFFDPFVESGPPALNIGVIGHDVLVSGPPKADLTKQCSLISAKDVANRARFDLAIACFPQELAATKSHLDKLTRDRGDHSLVFIDPAEVAGYRTALGIEAPTAIQKRTENVTEQMLDDGDCDVRRLGIHRKWQETKANGQLQVLTKANNFARDIINGKPVIIRHLMDPTMAARFVKDVVRLLPRVRNILTRRRIMSYLNYLAASTTGFNAFLKGCNFDSNWCREMTVPIWKNPESDWHSPPIAEHIVKALLSATDPYWTMITSFDMTELQEKVKKASPFPLPYRFRYPELLSEFVPLRPINEYHCVLIAKLYQLSHLRAMYVQSYQYNKVMHINWENFDQTKYNTQLRTTKTLISDSAHWPIYSICPMLTKEMLAFCLNAKEWDFVMRFELNLPIVTVAKLVAALGTSGNLTAEAREELFRGFYTQTRPYFEKTPVSRRGNENLPTREIARQRIDYIEFLRLLKEPTLVAFLVSYFATLINYTLALDKKPQLKIFAQHAAWFTFDLEHTNPHLEAIEECLLNVLNNALLTNPLNAFWLRTAADYHYIKGNMEEAATLYVETLIACKPDLKTPFPDNVVDDVMWSRMRVCLNRFRSHTMAALICQLISSKTRKEEESMKAVEIMCSQGTLDAGSESSYMLFDCLLTELMSQGYDSRKQFTALDTMLRWASRPAMNMNNRGEILAREQNRRCDHLLQTIAAQILGTGL